MPHSKKHSFTEEILQLEIVLPCLLDELFLILPDMAECNLLSHPEHTPTGLSTHIALTAP